MTHIGFLSERFDPIVFETLVISRDIGTRASIVRAIRYAHRSLGKISTSSRKRGKGCFARQAHPFPTPLSSRFLDFLPVWPRLNYRKPCFGCHGRIPISRWVARVAGTPYGVSRILYEFLSWNDSFICLSSIPSPPPPPPPTPLSISRSSISVPPPPSLPTPPKVSLSLYLSASLFI